MVKRLMLSAALVALVPLLGCQPGADEPATGEEISSTEPEEAAAGGTPVTGEAPEPGDVEEAPAEGDTEAEAAPAEEAAP